MKKMIKLTGKHQTKILLLLFLFGIVGIFWTFLASFGLGESGYNFMEKTKKVTLSPGVPVTQTFTAHADNIHQIRVVLGRADIKQGERIEFRLMDETCEETLVEEIFQSKPQTQGVYTVFGFPTLSHSKEKSYCFSALYASNENRRSEKPYLSAIDEPNPVFFDRTLTDTNKKKVYPRQTLFLRPAYTSGSLTSDLSRLIDRLSQYKPVFLKGWSIIILFAILIIGSIALAYRLVFTREKE